VRPQQGSVLGGRYRLTSRIAVGGMGEVWRATDDVLGREVAVKVLKEEYTGDPGFLQRFRAEARHTAALSHPNIAGVYDYGEADFSAYLVMELVPGEPLSDVLAREGTLAPQRAMGLLAQAAHGLSAAHAAGLVHRDVKPGNLLVTPDGRVKVTDFGIARAGDSAPLTATGTVMGTAQYLAPEQAMGRPSSPASDIYALGVVGYEALTGARPFTGESQVSIAMAHVNTPPPPLPEHLPPGARRLVEQSMAKQPSERPADALVFAAAAEAVSRGDDAAALAALGAPAPDADADAGATQLMAPPEDVAATQTLPPSAEVLGAAGGGRSGPPSTAPTPVVGEPAPAAGGGRPRRRLTGPLVALLALIAFVVVGALLAGQALGPDTPAAPAPTSSSVATPPPTQAPTTTAPPTTSAPPSTTSPPPTTNTPTEIQVVADDYVGRPLEEVAAELEAMGLRVRPQPERDPDVVGNVPPGTVFDVEEGTFEPGDQVTVVFADPREKGRGSEDSSTTDEGRDG
jgi:hypothetical protein